MDKKVTLDEAIEIIDAAAEPLPPEPVEVLMAGGRVIAERVNAWVDLPGADVAALDGFAVRADDLKPASPAAPVRLKLVGASSFNNPYDAVLPQAAAVKVVTGAILPAETTAVLPREAARLEGPDVLATAPLAAGHGVRRRAEEFRVGETVAEPGDALNPGRISLLIGAGWSEVKAARMPRARVLAVGDELKGPGQMIGPGQIYPSSAALVASWLRMIGVGDIRLILVADDPLDLLEAMPEPRVADLVITVGGTGHSDQDVVMAAFAEREVEVLFRGIAATPGHYAAFARLDDMPIVCLPGSPGAAEMMFQFLVRRTTADLMGLANPELTVLFATLATPLQARQDLERLVRVQLEPKDGTLIAHPLTAHKIHQEIVLSHGVVRVPIGKSIAAGASVPVHLTKYSTGA